MNGTAIASRTASAYQRRAAKWLARRAFTLPPGRPIISFTFDDFPRSALEVGGPLLDRHGVKATYYVSLGIAGRTEAAGAMFQFADLNRVIAAGHELGCHTFDHCPAWATGPDAFEASVVHNAKALAQYTTAPFRTLSYPISYPRPATKRRMSRIFACCRGGGQTFSTGKVDLNYVKAFFLEQCGEDMSGIRALLDATCAAGGWLIFATHDISPHPSRFGCTPDFFEAVVAAAAESGATLLPVAAACQELQRRAMR